MIKGSQYSNSPESEIYHKSKVLYGYFKPNSLSPNLIIVFFEGILDVIQFNQAGIENVVSSSTALTPDQIRLINRLTKNNTVLLTGMQLDYVLPFEE
jgi:DNA primase